MLKKITILVLFVVTYYFSFSQKESFIWYFGYSAGLDFNYDPPNILSNGAMRHSGGSGTISDHNGNLLFYTDGQYVYNKNHQLMKNGGNIGGNNKVNQSGLIIPSPGLTNIYYIFSNNNICNFSYSIVDMNKEGGLGAVTSKNNILIPFDGTEKVTAVRHSNQCDVWVITHKYNSNAFYVYLVTGTGIIKTPIISYSGSNLDHVAYKVGQLKVSPDGNLLVNTINGKGFELFYFDTRTGSIIAPYYSVMDLRKYVGAEFSPNGRYLYLTHHGGPTPIKESIWQYDLNSRDSIEFINSKVFINSTITAVGTCQLAIDGKIYVGGLDPCLHIITKPSFKGSACNYIDTSICYNPLTASPGYCFPDFLQSYFYVPDFKTEHLCLGDTTHFKLTDTYRVDSVFWDFNDTVSGINNHSKLIEPKHYFADTGIYKVSIIVYRDTLTDTFNRNIRISPYPSDSFTVSDTTLCLKGNIFNFTNSSSINTGSITYEWDYGDSIKGFINDPIHSYLRDSIYRVRLVAISDYGCTDTAYQELTVLPSPSASFSVSDSMLCFKSNLFRFTNNSTINKQDSLHFVWSFGDSLTDTMLNPVHSYLNDDTFHIMLVNSSLEGCKDTAKGQVIVNPSPSAVFSVNDTVQCFHHNFFSFQNHSVISKDTILFHWDFGDSVTSNVFDTSFSYAKTGNYKVSLIATSGHGCTDTATVQLTVNPGPVASFTINDSTQCFYMNKFSFINTSSIAKDSFLSHWDFGDRVHSINFSDDHRYTDTGKYTAKLIINSIYGCGDSASKNMEVYSDAIVKSVTETDRCGPGKLTLFAEAINGIINWYSTDVGGVLIYQGDTFVTNAGTTYYVEAENQHCTSSPRIPVKAFIKYVPVIVSTTPASSLLPTSITLRAYTSAGIVNWYDTSIGGVLLANGNSFTTPFLDSSKTYYVDATYLDCTTGTRTGVKANIGSNGINDKIAPIKLLIYPNPSNDFINISIIGISDKTSLSIVDIQGRIKFCKEIKPTGNQYKGILDVSNLVQGMYYIILENQQLYKVVRFGKM